MKGVLLHGGTGTRLRPLTYTDVKQLLPIAGKPISEYALENLVELGIKEVNIIVGDVGGREVREYYSDGSKWNVDISYTFQEKPLGIAHAIGLTENFVDGEDFVVILGDNYFQNGVKSLHSDFRQFGPDALVALTEVGSPSQYGIATVEKGKIVRMEEKPKDAKSNLAIAGAYFLRNNIFEIIRELRPSRRNELEITEAFQMMLEKRMNIGYSVIKGWWKDTGTVEEFLDCNRMVLDRIEGSTIQGLHDGKTNGRVKLGANVKFLGSTRIMGPCYIGDNTIVDNSYIGPYTSVGSRCVLKNIEIEDSVIMDECSIDVSDETRITDSLIGPSTRVSTYRSKPRALKLVVGRDSKIEL